MPNVCYSEYEKYQPGKISPSFQFIWITSIFMKNHSVRIFFFGERIEQNLARIVVSV